MKCIGVSTWSSTAQTIRVWHQSTARSIRKHADTISVWHQSTARAIRKHADTISVWHQSTARAIRKHAEPSLYIDQWEPSVICSYRGALMSYSDRSACAVPLHYMTSYTFQAGARKQNHDGGRGSNLFQKSFCTFTFSIPTAGKTWLNITKMVCKVT